MPELPPRYWRTDLPELPFGLWPDLVAHAPVTCRSAEDRVEAQLAELTNSLAFGSTLGQIRAA